MDDGLSQRLSSAHIYPARVSQTLRLIRAISVVLVVLPPHDRRPLSMPPELCGDPFEGWGPVSHIRQFDLTPCFEEGIILSSLLVVFIAFAAFRCHALRSYDPYPRCRKSVHILRAKLVRGSVNLPCDTRF